MKKRLLVLGLGCVLILGGCGAQWPGMTDEQAQKIGEYAAITLLKYDANSRSRLVDLSRVEPPAGAELTPEVTPPPEEVEEPEPVITETPVIDNTVEKPEAVSLEEFLGLPDGFLIRYLGEEICQSYPEGENDYFALEATPGKQLLVLNFQIKNDSGVAQSIDLLGRHDLYRVTVNDSYTRNALTTMLTNDMSTYEGSIASGESKLVVLLVEIDQSQTGAPTSIVLNLKNDSGTYKVQLM